MRNLEIVPKSDRTLDYPVPMNEDFRLKVLHSHRILDTASEPSFDRISRLATIHFKVPMSIVSLVDEDRQWCKAAIGTDFTETPRQDAFCTHTIIEKEPMVVLDATKDPRFVNNPLVTGHPGLRFYVGAPLITSENVALGALCLLDTYPRGFFSPEDRQYLADLADVVVEQMELRRANLPEQAETHESQRMIG
ncbi:MAG: GAF domain-containing protein [Rhodospirillales bacterium]